MINYGWQPTQNLAGWKNNYTFQANTTYNGIPYSQTGNQKDDVGFGTALGASDFYQSYAINGVIMPKYGSDCSGFVSFTWGISRQTTSSFLTGINNGTYPKVGSYSTSNPTTATLKSSYALLKTGDALVVGGSHILLVDQNNPTFNTPSIYIYEQTPYLATWTIWTYDQLANGKYLPFAKNSL